MVVSHRPVPDSEMKVIMPSMHLDELKPSSPGPMVYSICYCISAARKEWAPTWASHVSKDNPKPSYRVILPTSEPLSSFSCSGSFFQKIDSVHWKKHVQNPRRSIASLGTYSSSFFFLFLDNCKTATSFQKEIWLKFSRAYFVVPCSGVIVWQAVTRYPLSSFTASLYPRLTFIFLLAACIF